MPFQLRVVEPTGNTVVVDLCDTEEQKRNFTVKQLKEKITAQLNIDGDIRMVYGTEQLDESSLVIGYGIRHLSTIHTLLMLPGGL